MRKGAEPGRPSCVSPICLQNSSVAIRYSWRSAWCFLDLNKYKKRPVSRPPFLDVYELAYLLVASCVVLVSRIGRYTASHSLCAA